MFLMGFIPQHREVIFLVGSISLFAGTLGIRPKREYYSIPLSIFLVSTLLVTYFVHISKLLNTIPKTAPIFSYIGYCILANGSIYVICGTLLLLTIIRYTNNFRLVSNGLVLASIPYLRSMIYHGRMTILFSLLLAVIVYSLINKRRWLLSRISIITGIIVVFNIPWLLMKFQFRPIVWSEMWEVIKTHPIVGNGFQHFLHPSSMMYSSIRQALERRHNDFMALWMDVGIISTVAVLYFVLSEYWKLKNRVISIPILTMIIACCFQCIMYGYYPATLFIVLGGVVIGRTC